MRKLPLILLILFCFTGCTFEIDTESDVVSSAYPEFSWDTVPVCVHVSKGYGYDDFTDEEIARMAEFPLVSIEKNQGYRLHGCMELGTYVTAKAVKAINPKAKVLLYRNSVVDYGKFYSHGVTLSDEIHPEWALLYKDGSYVIQQGDEDMRYYCHGVEELRDWWVNTIYYDTYSDYIDGIFIDGVPKVAANSSNKENQYGYDNYWAHYNGFHTSLTTLREKYNGKKMMIGNALRGDTGLMDDMGLHFLDYLDGGMIESYGISTSMETFKIANHITILQEAAKQSKIVMAAATPNTEVDGYDENWTDEQVVEFMHDCIELPLAVFLVGAGKYAYFMYTCGLRENQGGLEYFDELQRPLGEPKGDAVQDGYVYTREFEHASVWVDIDKKEAKITWDSE